MITGLVHIVKSINTSAYHNNLAINRLNDATGFLLTLAE